MTLLADIDDNFHVCFICRRRADGIGVTKRKHSPPRWICHECGPAMAKRALSMPRDFDLYEEKAVVRTVDAVGEYLTRIGKTDLAEMESHEALDLIRTVINGFGAAVREECKSLEAPF